MLYLRSMKLKAVLPIYISLVNHKELGFFGYSIIYSFRSEVHIVIYWLYMMLEDYGFSKASSSFTQQLNSHICIYWTLNSYEKIVEDGDMWCSLNSAQADSKKYIDGKKYIEKIYMYRKKATKLYCRAP